MPTTNRWRDDDHTFDGVLDVTIASWQFGRITGDAGCRMLILMLGGNTVADADLLDADVRGAG